MKWIKRISIALLVFVLVASVGFVGWTQVSLYAPTPAAAAVMPSAQTNGWLVFKPEQPADKGFIFYPGGLVDAQAYAPLARQIADRGVFVVIVPMPLNLAIFNFNAANQVVTQFPQIKQWAIGGHSLGGAMAAQFFVGNPQAAEKINGLVLWGARSNADISALPLNVVSIFGTQDGIAPADINDEMRLFGLPASTRLVPIEGGNHSMFGDYGLQKGDNPLAIPVEDAHRQIVDATVSVFK